MNPSSPSELLIGLILQFSLLSFQKPVRKQPETSPETNIRILGEMEYRESVTPTLWHCYITLGRYATDGFSFDSYMESIDTEPKAAFSAMWYQLKC